MVQGSFSGLGRPGVNAKPEENCQLFFDGEYLYIYIILYYINCQLFFDGEATGLIRGLQH
jgi:hypothetical protein